MLDDGRRLLQAAEKGLLDDVKALLDSRTDVEVQDYSGWTALGKAADHGHLEVVRVLLDKRANLNAKDSVNYTPLHRAVQHDKVVEALLRKGSSVSVSNSKGRTPLHESAVHGTAEVVTMLLKRKANLEAAEKHGQTPLHMAAEFGRADAVRVLLERSANLEARNNVGATPLHLAAAKGKVDALKRLLERGAWTESQDIAGLTAAQLAVAGSHTKCLIVLLGRGSTWEDDGRQLAWIILQEGPEPAAVLETLLRPLQLARDEKFVGQARLVGRLSTFTSRSLLPSTDSTGVFGETSKDDTCSRVLCRCRRIPIAKASLYSVPGYPVGAMTSDAVLQALVETPNQEVLATPLAEAIVSHAWGPVWLANGCDTTLNTVMVLSACWAAFRLRNDASFEAISFGILAAALGKRAAEELFQLPRRCLSRGSCSAYLSQGRAFWDCVFFACNLGGLYFMAAPSSSPVRKGWLAAWFAQLWLRLLYSLRVLSCVGPRFIPIFNAIADATSFAMVVAFCLAGATHAYYTIGRQEEPTPFYAAWLQVFSLGVLGSFDLLQLEGLAETLVAQDGTSGSWSPEDPGPSADYVVVQLFLRARAGAIMELFVILRDEPSPDQLRSFRSFVENKMDRRLQKVHAELGELRQDVSNMKQDMSSMAKQLGDRLDKLTDMLSAPKRPALPPLETASAAPSAILAAPGRQTTLPVPGRQTAEPGKSTARSTTRKRRGTPDTGSG